MDERIPPSHVKLKRVYAPAALADGTRILVDRQWPRGVKTTAAAIDRWEKELAPSDALREWFEQDKARWQEFRHCYEGELREHRENIERLRTLARQGHITLVSSARDQIRNHAV